ncbi:hypothetical protein DMENIID0001_123930 [Sergentomyia squamirostris]
MGRTVRLGGVEGGSVAWRNSSSKDDGRKMTEHTPNPTQPLTHSLSRYTLWDKMRRMSRGIGCEQRDGFTRPTLPLPRNNS